MLQKYIKTGGSSMPEADILQWMEEGQFGRYYMYREIINFIKREFHSKTYLRPHIIELGGSNTIIKHMFNHPSYEIAPNYPELDVTDLKPYAANIYDFAVMDQVLEHVNNPWKAVREVHRILKKGGWFINTTPFLIEIHEVPADYWRFTADALKELMADFSHVEVYSWGNKKTALWQIGEERWPTVKEARDTGHFELENQEKFPIVYWVFAKK
jgi:SAM-dependent methyltransferase